MLTKVLLALVAVLWGDPTGRPDGNVSFGLAAEISQGGDVVAAELTAEDRSFAAFGAAAASAAGEARGAGSGPGQPDQTLTTRVQDPNNPDEPWEVTTYRKPGESLEAFVKRHREMVEAVRDALGR